MTKYYVVAYGRKPGIYTNSSYGHSLIVGVSGSHAYVTTDNFLAQAYFQIYRGVPKVGGLIPDMRKVEKLANSLKEQQCGVIVQDGNQPLASTLPYNDWIAEPTETESGIRVLPDLPDNITSDDVIIFTDGSYDQQTGRGGYAARLFFGVTSASYIDMSGSVRNGRDPTFMEIKAVWKALKKLSRYRVANHLYVITDSRHAIGAITKLSECKAGKKKTTRKARKRLQQYNSAMIWVKAHSGSIWNEHCDKLAKAASAASAHKL